MSGFVLGPSNRFQWKCPKCKSHYRTTVNGNFTCPLFLCNNAVLVSMPIGATGKAFKKKTDLGRMVELKTTAGKRQEAMQKNRKEKFLKQTFKNRNLDYDSVSDEDLEDEIGADTDVIPDDLDDFDYVPEKPYSIHMRLTTGDMQVLGFPPVLAQIGTFTQAIADAAQRKDTAVTMGAHLNLKRLSAWSASNLLGRPIGVKYDISAHGSAEWCHLVAASLGGPTIPDNLTSASFAANTYMACIEEKLSARTDLIILVDVDGIPDPLYALSAFVAEKITYKCINRRNNAVLFTEVINARITQFFQTNRTALHQRITTAIGTK